MNFCAATHAKGIVDMGKDRMCTNRRIAELGAPARKSGYPRQRGFSLVEALVGLGVFAVGMLGVAMLTTRATHDTGDSRVYSATNQFLAAKVESLGIAAAEGPATLLSRLNGLTKTPNPKVVGDIGVTLTKAVDGNNVDLVPLKAVAADKLPPLRPPYVLVFTPTYTSSMDKTSNLTPVTRVIVPW